MVEAERFAREALETLRPTEFTWQIADALMVLADVLYTRGRQSEAREAALEALDRYRSKGIVPSIERASALLGALGSDRVDG